MLKRLFSIVVFLLGGLTPLFALYSQTNKALQGVLALQPTVTEQNTCKYVTQYLMLNHLNKIAAKDSLSLAIMDRFLNNLDGSKSLFLTAEVDSLKNVYGNRIIDESLAGKVNAGLAIYNLFLNRSLEKINFMHDAIAVAHFDFSQPEIIVLDRKKEPWPSSHTQRSQLWLKELKYRWLSMSYAEKNDKKLRVGLYKSLTDREGILRAKSSEDAFHAYLEAIASSFDPHTSYFTKMQSEEFQISMRHSVEGIGVMLDTDGDFVVVTEIIPGGSAYKSKVLKKGDKIIGIGQGLHGRIEDVFGRKLVDIAELIRGKKGTKVHLKILPSNSVDRRAAKIVELEREKVDLLGKAVSKRVVKQNGKKIGMIIIPSFYLDFEAQEKKVGKVLSMSRDVAVIVNELKRDGVDGIVLDLRNNGGGALEEALKLAGLFISSGPYGQMSNAEVSFAIFNSDENTRQIYSGPLAVLVNRYTASASEIFAAAIQDYGRGLIIGERTYGKGTIQNIITIPVTEKLTEHGSIKFTIAKCFRLSGKSIQNKGIEPDIIIPSMINAERVGEELYSNSLPWSSISPALYEKSNEANVKKINVLRSNFQQRSLKDILYQQYLGDLNTLDQIRSRTGVTLQESLYRSEMDALKEIDKKWSHPDDSSKDIILQEALGVIADYITLKGA